MIACGLIYASKPGRVTSDRPERRVVIAASAPPEQGLGQRAGRRVLQYWRLRKVRSGSGVVRCGSGG